MVQKERETQIQMHINDELVLDYLMANPNFFMRNAEHLEDIKVPHGIHGTVSLVEWQLKRQRQRISVLEDEITGLFERAQLNENLFNQLLGLIMSLTDANDLNDFLRRLKSWTRRLGLSDVVIRLFDDVWKLEPPFSHVELALAREQFESLRINKLNQKKHYLGQLNPTELNLILTQRTLVGSVALSLLEGGIDSNVYSNNSQEINNAQHSKLNCNLVGGEIKQFSGIVLFISPHEHHFVEGIDTALLEQLTHLLPRLLRPWIEMRYVTSVALK